MIHDHLYARYSRNLSSWAPAGFFSGGEQRGGLKDGSPPAWFRGKTPVGVCGLSLQKLNLHDWKMTNWKMTRLEFGRLEKDGLLLFLHLFL